MAARRGLHRLPWLSGGYAHTDGPLAGYAPLVGVYGISPLGRLRSAADCGGRDALGAGRDGRRTGLVALASALALPLAGAALVPLAWTQPAGQPIRVRLLQGNVPQDMKFEPVGVQRSLELYRDSSRQPRRTWW